MVQRFFYSVKYSDHSPWMYSKTEESRALILTCLFDIQIKL